MSVELVGVNNGRYNVFVIKNDQYIGPCISSGHEWDGWMRDDVSKYYKEGTDILDIGANIGYNTLMFSDYGPVHTFEPVFHEIVSKNAKSNNLKHSISVYPCALSNDTYISTIYLPSHFICGSEDKLNYGGTSFHHEGNVRGDSVDVKCEKLDQVYKGTPSFIKIDVEGHELQVLEGAVNTIKTHMPAILIEIHEFTCEHPVHVFLKELGYDEPESRPEVMFLYLKK